MFRLTNKLAVSNLIKNRKLYYPFALAVLLAVTITYLFYSLTFNPKIAEIRGGTTIQATLGFGMFVVTLASAIIPNHSYLSQLDVTYKTPDLMSHFLPPHEVSF
ncbi:hypothetical protein ACREZX_02490, partial [Streptococcus pneumoniae]